MKQEHGFNLERLGIFGGEPAFPETLHVGRPNIGDRGKLLERINNALDSRWLTNNGPYSQEFERRAGEITGAKYNLAFVNATVALEILYKALGLRGEVIVPSFTFVATVHALEWLGIRPVFCDIEPDGHNIDPQQVEALITPQTSGIIGVHLWGKPCSIDELERIAKEYDLSLAFDAAHAFGCSYQGRMLGIFGDAEVFSFHATKYLNSFEGGLVSTNNDQLADQIRNMRNFGFTDYATVEYLGMNGKMHEISAAMGITSIESREEITNTNRKNYALYHENLQDIPGIQLTEYDAGEINNYQYIVLDIDPEQTGISRDRIYKILHRDNVLARRYFYPGVHRMEPYKSKYPGLDAELPNTMWATQSLLQLPTGTAVSSSDIKKICDLIGFLVEHSEKINHRLEQE